MTQLVHVINTIFLNKPHLDKKKKDFPNEFESAESSSKKEITVDVSRGQKPKTLNFMKAELAFVAAVMKESHTRTWVCYQNGQFSKSLNRVA